MKQELRIEWNKDETISNEDLRRLVQEGYWIESASESTSDYMLILCRLDD